MPLPLQVQFSEKDEVKQLGAWWSAEQKTWIIPDHVTDITRFKKWIPHHQGIIIRKPYRLLITARRCWKCDKVTPMVALAGFNYHSFEYLDENDPESTQEWIKGEEPTVFAFVTEMDEHLNDYLKIHFPFFRSTHSKTLEEKTWANNCQLCGRLQGEWHNHEDFDGAFFPDPYEGSPFEFKLHEMALEMDFHILADFGSLDFNEIELQNGGSY